MGIPHVALNLHRGCVYAMEELWIGSKNANRWRGKGDSPGTFLPNLAFLKLVALFTDLTNDEKGKEKRSWGN